MLDIHGLMQELSESRPIFHSEADFQLALFRLINKRKLDCQIRMEEPFSLGGKRKRYLDIWLPTKGTAIELKYFTMNLKAWHGREPFTLKDHISRDLTRRLFLNDVERLERLIRCMEPLGDEEQTVKAGYAVLLANDPYLWDRKKWKERKKRVPNDFYFRLHEGETIKGKLKWLNKGQENPDYTIKLTGCYDTCWKCYSHPAKGKYGGEFRYMAFKIQPTT